MRHLADYHRERYVHSADIVASFVIFVAAEAFHLLTFIPIICLGVCLLLDICIRNDSIGRSVGIHGGELGLRSFTAFRELFLFVREVSVPPRTFNT